MGPRPVGTQGPFGPRARLARGPFGPRAWGVSLLILEILGGFLKIFVLSASNRCELWRRSEAFRQQAGPPLAYGSRSISASANSRESSASMEPNIGQLGADMWPHGISAGSPGAGATTSGSILARGFDFSLFSVPILAGPLFFSTIPIIFLISPWCGCAVALYMYVEYWLDLY